MKKLILTMAVAGLLSLSLVWAAEAAAPRPVMSEEVEVKREVRRIPIPLLAQGDNTSIGFARIKTLPDGRRLGWLQVRPCCTCHPMVHRDNVAACGGEVVAFLILTTDVQEPNIRSYATSEKSCWNRHNWAFII